MTTLTAREVFRAYETDGVPSSGAHKPIKEEIIQLLEQYELQLPAHVADATGPATMSFAEDADNGTSAVTLGAPSSLAANRQFVLPDADVIVTSFIAALLNTSSSAAAAAALGLKERLTANRTYYIRLDGNDSNTGLADTSGGAFLTLQGAHNAIRAAVDFSGYTVTVQIADGTYTVTGDALVSGFGWVGGGSLVFQGNSATPANVVISSTGYCFHVTGAIPGTLDIKDMQLTSSGAGCIAHSGIGDVRWGNIRFGAASTYHIFSNGPAAKLECLSNYAVIGAAQAHWQLALGVIRVIAKTITITGTPAFTAWVQATLRSAADVWSNTYSGSATGKRYDVQQSSVVNTVTGATLPGNASGTYATGGQFI